MFFDVQQSLRQMTPRLPRSKQTSVARAAAGSPLPAGDGGDAGLSLSEQVARLRPVIDRVVREHGRDPETQAAQVAIALRDKWQSAQWAEVMFEAGLPGAPGFDLRWAVINDYKERGGRLVDLLIVDPVRDAGALR